MRTDAGGVDRPAVHAQTTAFYALLDRLRAAHPGLEIESCSSGGARVDLGVLARTDRIWTSDCNDALERAQIQRWTSLLVPAELMGTHVGPATAHTTHRTLDLSFRMLVALQGHAGLEWDITAVHAGRARGAGRLVGALPRAAAAAPLRRPRPRRPPRRAGPARDRDGRAGRRAGGIHASCGPTPGRRCTPGLVGLPGLDPTRTYTVRVRREAGLPAVIQHVAPAWWDEALGDGIRVSGALLGQVGLPLPVLGPAQGFLLHLT